MTLTRNFRETVQSRARRDSAYRRGLLTQAVESLLSGELALGKELLRDYINATVGFARVAEHVELHIKTLHQMLGPKGNPTAKNLFRVVAYLQRAEGTRLRIHSALDGSSRTSRLRAPKAKRARSSAA